MISSFIFSARQLVAFTINHNFCFFFLPFFIYKLYVFCLFLCLQAYNIIALNVYELKSRSLTEEEMKRTFGVFFCCAVLNCSSNFFYL